MLRQVKPSTTQVLQTSTYVTINHKNLRKFADTLPTTTFQQLSYEEPFHFMGETAATLKYILLLDTLNFGSGYRLNWENPEFIGIYQQVATALKQLLESEPAFSAADLANIEREQLATILVVPLDFPLLSAFEQCWRALGQYVLTTYKGDFVQIFSRCQHSAAALVAELATQLSAFRDISTYNGKPVYFLKKAQCVAADTWLALQGQGLGRFDDIALLTTFADNVIPQILHAQGVLSYQPNLEAKIAAGELLPMGSVYEVEIRAAAVQAVEHIRDYLATRGKTVLSIQIDWYLWNLGQTADYHSQPVHLTETIYY